MAISFLLVVLVAGGQGVVVRAAGGGCEAGRADEEGGVLVPAARHDRALVGASDGDRVRVGPAGAGGSGLGWQAFAGGLLPRPGWEVAAGARFEVDLGAVGGGDLEALAERRQGVDDLVERGADEGVGGVAGEGGVPAIAGVSAGAAPDGDGRPDPADVADVVVDGDAGGVVGAGVAVDAGDGGGLPLPRVGGGFQVSRDGVVQRPAPPQQFVAHRFGGRGQGVGESLGHRGHDLDRCAGAEGGVPGPLADGRGVRGDVPAGPGGGVVVEFDRGEEGLVQGDGGVLPRAVAAPGGGCFEEVGKGCLGVAWSGQVAWCDHHFEVGGGGAQGVSFGLGRGRAAPVGAARLSVIRLRPVPRPRPRGRSCPRRSAARSPRDAARRCRRSAG